MKVYDLENTISAVATPYGEGGIGIIRISGPLALQSTLNLFRPKKNVKTFESHKLYYGDIVDPCNGSVVDEGLIVYMKSPRSFTREDVVEINCHGGTLIMQRIMEMLMREGVREAGPGEFTKRAFLNGRIDLSQAEAVIDVIRAKTDSGLKVANRQLKGGLKEETGAIKGDLTSVLAVIEAYIDFPEEDIEFAPLENLKTRLKLSEERIERLLATYEEGRVYREGIHVVIAGKPNVGKSSLLNAILQEKRAIVTHIPGTTRDVIEEVVNIKGIPVNLIDTAGIRDTGDTIEGEGIKKTREKLAEADIVLYMVDEGGLEASDREELSAMGAVRTILVYNKVDMLTWEEIRNIGGSEGDRCCVPVSAVNSTGLEELKNAIYNTVLSHGAEMNPSLVISRKRHKVALEEASGCIKRATKEMDDNLSYEFISADIREALSHLGDMAGETTPEDVLEQIFSEFCIGK